MRKYIVLILCLTAMAGYAQKVTNASIQKLQKEQSALQSQINESEKLLKSTKKDVQTQLSNLAVINSQIDEKKKYVDGIQQQVDTMAKLIHELEAEEKQLQAELDECKAKYQRGSAYMYRNQKMQNKMMFLFSSKDYKTLYRRARYMQEYAKYQKVQGAMLRDKEDAVRAKREEVQSAKSEKERLAAQGRAEQKNLESKQAERQQIVDGLNKKSKQLQNTIAANKKKYADLNAKIDKLIQEEIRRQEAKRKEEERKRKEAEERARREANRNNSSGKTNRSSGKTDKPYANGNSNGTGSMHAADEADRKLSNSFASNQGRLPVPITGPYTITGHFGQNSIQGISGVSIPNKGTNYTGQSGAQARAVFEGEVISVFSLGGTVNVIVRHGNYMTAYCYLSSASVHRGQKVSTKQTLGTVARDASGNYTLQIQIYKMKERLNPESWIAR